MPDNTSPDIIVGTGTATAEAPSTPEPVSSSTDAQQVATSEGSSSDLSGANDTGMEHTKVEAPGIVNGYGSTPPPSETPTTPEPSATVSTPTGGESGSTVEATPSESTDAEATPPGIAAMENSGNPSPDAGVSAAPSEPAPAPSPSPEPSVSATSEVTPSPSIDTSSLASAPDAGIPTVTMPEDPATPKVDSTNTATSLTPDQTQPHPVDTRPMWKKGLDGLKGLFGGGHPSAETSVPTSGSGVVGGSTSPTESSGVVSSSDPQTSPSQS